ncbi:phage head completion protein [Edwardsiella tarda]|uniref:phage head completion protein n=1 Tax=Edwardsiella tarda TaxID=636 RepID=UPI0015868ADA
MRIGLMRNQIEIWSATKSINEYGVEVEAKELMLQCPAAAKYVKTDLQGNNIKQRQVVVEFTVRFNRFFNAPDESHYIRFDGDEWDIINTNNWHSLNKTITLTAVKRSK